MKRFGQIINIKPEGRAEYIKLHEKIPPKVAAIIRGCNIQNYSIFIKGDILFAYYEYAGKDYAADMAMMAAAAETQKWWDTVKPLMLPLADRKADEFWSDMHPVFYQE